MLNNDSNLSDQEGEDQMDQFSNPDIQEVAQKTGLKNITYEELIQQKNERIKTFHEEDQKLKEGMLRHWLTTRGKRHMIDFDDKERSKLKQYFGSLDEDGSGSIGIEELEDPLISLGIAESRDDVKKIIDTVDDDKSGQIEFKEFLDIIKNKNSDGNEKDTLIIDFFKDMINGKLGQGKIPKSLPFGLIISTIRRKKLLDAIMGEGKKKDEGEKVMKAYGKLIAIKKAQKYNPNDTSESYQSNRSYKMK